MSDKVVIDVETNGRWRAFVELDEHQRQAILDAKKLEVQMKQAEAAAQHYANVAAAGHEKVNRAATQAAAAEERLNAKYTQRINLRHGAGTALTQAQRIEAREFAANYSGGPVPANIYATQLAQGQRTATAARLREDRRRQKEQIDRETRQEAQDRAMAERFEMEAMTKKNNRQADDLIFEAIKRRRGRLALRAQLLKEKEDKLQAEFDRDIAPGLIGGGAIAAGLRGVGNGDDDALTRRARRIVSRRVAGNAELAGRVSEQDLDNMVRLQAERLQRRQEQWTTVGSAAGAGLTAAVGGLYAVDAGSRQQKAAAADRLNAALPDARELKQIADNAADYRSLLNTAETLRASGLGAENALRTVFAGKSAGLIDESFADAISTAHKINLDPKIALNAVQKVRGNWSNAGNTNEIIGQLLIAAGPSPAGVSDLAAGVGTVANSFSAMGGSAKEAMASLGVLSGPNKNVDAAAERIKSVADQINKKKNRILFDGPALEGLDLITELPRLASQGRLRGADGRAQTVDDFLEESNAIIGARDLANQQAAIRAQVAEMRSGNVGQQAAGRAGYYDPATNAADLAEKFKNRQKQAEEKAWGADKNIADAVQAHIMGNMVDAGAGPTARFTKEGLDKLRRSDMIGSGDADYAMNMIFKGDVKDPELMQGVFANMLRRYDEGVVEAYARRVESGEAPLTNRSRVWRPGDANKHFLATGEVTQTRQMPADVKAAALSAAQVVLQKNAEDRAKSSTAAKQVKLEDVLGNAYKSLSNSSFVTTAGQFGDLINGFNSSRGYDPNSRRAKVFRDTVTKFASSAMVADALPGVGGPDQYSRILTAGKAGTEAEYQDNLQRIKEVEDEAKAALADSPKGTADYDYAKARYDQIRGLTRSAKRTGGRIDAIEANAIVDQIEGKGDSAKVFDNAVTKFAEVIAGLPGILQSGDGGKKDKDGVWTSSDGSTLPLGDPSKWGKKLTPAEMKYVKKPDRGTHNPL